MPMKGEEGIVGVLLGDLGLGRGNELEEREWVRGD
jgi:hypothetical protein